MLFVFRKMLHEKYQQIDLFVIMENILQNF